MGMFYSIPVDKIQELEYILVGSEFYIRRVVTYWDPKKENSSITNFQIPGFDPQSLDEGLSKKWRELPIKSLGHEVEYYSRPENRNTNGYHMYVLKETRW